MMEPEHEPSLDRRVARLTLGGGLLVLATGSCVTEMGLAAGELRDALMLGVVTLGLGLPLLWFGVVTRRAARQDDVADATANVVEPLRTEVLPGGGFDVPFETDPGLSEPSLELDIQVIAPVVPAVPGGEEWFVVEARSALFGPLEAGAA